MQKVRLHRFIFITLMVLTLQASIASSDPIAETTISTLKRKSPEFLALVGEDTFRLGIDSENDPSGKARFEAALAKLPEKEREKMRTLIREISNIKKNRKTLEKFSEKPLLAKADLGKGVEFPDPKKAKELLDAKKKGEGVTNKPLEKQERSTVRALAEIANQKSVVLPSCPKPITNKLPIRGVAKSEKIVKDMLFVRFDPPKNAQEIFGDHTRVYRITNDEKDIVSKAAMRIGVPCLPFRMRLTESASFQHFGADALKHYDSKTGVQSTNPFVKEREHELLK